MWRGVVGCGLALSLLAGCGFRHHAQPIAAEEGAMQVGTASWYGPGFHGNRTSSGEIYDQYELTAAHQTLPLGTRVVVTSLQTGRSVEVRINDRGPFVGDRIIDLSYAAARTIGMIGPGTGLVRIEVLGESPVQLASAGFSIQVGAFVDRGNAVRLKETLAKRFEGVHVATLDGAAGRYYRVRLGRFARRDAAVAAARSVTPLGLPAVIVEDNGR